MKIELKKVRVRDLVEDYEDNDDLGVMAYGGKLDVRPPYQREFVYKDKQRDAVIETLRRDFPLNVMYWAVRDDGTFEVIDGQQRTVSICQYVESDFSIPIDGHQLSFHNLQQDQQDQILDYELMVYLCEGTDSEKLDWFKTINIAGEKLTDQELRNAVYHGKWVSAAKKYFSKNGCPAYAIGSDYMMGSPIRQDYLETVIKWINNGDVDGYMAAHQHDLNANPLWLYFHNVMAWVKATFPKLRKEMRSVQWGLLYNQFKDADLNPAKLEAEISTLMQDEDVTKKPGIYVYVLNREERHLSIRAFTDNQKREAYEQQEGICPVCKEHFELAEMEADHITPWHAGGRTIAANCKMLCKDDNRRKGGV
ncbi:GmrSD restriction endonuclease domain-containing protein [Streptomyces sp. enrichment culture]|uniref:GmrSD restriction endonuclease domain-containing protein n=1 Tax=Streptomyces sp. enrichment culture TaxID=1795815 RepID=UPI003F551F0B